MKNLKTIVRSVDPALLWVVLALILLLLTMWLFDGKETDPLIVDVAAVDELTSIYEEHQYTWPPSQPVPQIFVESFPEDLGALQASDKKSLFFRALLPMILNENNIIHAERELLLSALGEAGTKLD